MTGIAVTCALYSSCVHCDLLQVRHAQATEIDKRDLGQELCLRWIQCGHWQYWGEDDCWSNNLRILWINSCVNLEYLL